MINDIKTIIKYSFISDRNWLHVENKKLVIYFFLLLITIHRRWIACLGFIVMSDMIKLEKNTSIVCTYSCSTSVRRNIMLKRK